MYDRRPVGKYVGHFAFLLGLVVLCSLVVWTLLASAGLTARGAKAQKMQTIDKCSWAGELDFVLEQPEWVDGSVLVAVELQAPQPKFGLIDYAGVTARMDIDTQNGTLAIRDLPYMTQYWNGSWINPPMNAATGLYQTIVDSSGIRVGCLDIFGTMWFSIDNVITTQANFIAVLKDDLGIDLMPNIDMSVTLPQTDNETCEWWDFSCWLGKFNPLNLIDIGKFEEKFGALWQAPIFLFDFVNSLNPLGYIDVDKNTCPATLPNPAPSHCVIEWPLPFHDDNSTVSINAGGWRNMFSGQLGMLVDFMFTIIGVTTIIMLSNRMYENYLQVVEHGK